MLHRDPHETTQLDAGPVVGTFLKIPRFEVVDLLALAGFDFVVCDYEHSQMSLLDATDIVRAGVGRGLPVVVRVPGLNRGDINRLLEAGAAGIQLARGSGMRLRAPHARFVPAARLPLCVTGAAGRLLRRRREARRALRALEPRHPRGRPVRDGRLRLGDRPGDGRARRRIHRTGGSVGRPRHAGRPRVGTDAGGDRLDRGGSRSRRCADGASSRAQRMRWPRPARRATATSWPAQTSRC